MPIEDGWLSLPVYYRFRWLCRILASSWASLSLSCRPRLSKSDGRLRGRFESSSLRKDLSSNLFLQLFNRCRMFFGDFEPWIFSHELSRSCLEELSLHLLFLLVWKIFGSRRWGLGLGLGLEWGLNFVRWGAAENWLLKFFFGLIFSMEEFEMMDIFLPPSGSSGNL